MPWGVGCGPYWSWVGFPRAPSLTPTRSSSYKPTSYALLWGLALPFPSAGVEFMGMTYVSYDHRHILHQIQFRRTRWRRPWKKTPPRWAAAAACFRIWSYHNGVGASDALWTRPPPAMSCLVAHVVSIFFCFLHQILWLWLMSNDSLCICIILIHCHLLLIHYSVYLYNWSLYKFCM